MLGVPGAGGDDMEGNVVINLMMDQPAAAEPQPAPPAQPPKEAP